MPNLRTLIIVLAVNSASVHAGELVTSKVATAEEVMSLIDSAGAREVIRKNYDRRLWLTAIIPGIESAKPEWLEVAVKLRSASDAAAAEDLGSALFRAIAVDPLRVIPVIDRIYESQPLATCNMTFEAEAPKEGVSKYIAKIRRGLQSAKSPEERRIAAECAKGLDATVKYAKIHGIK